MPSYEQIDLFLEVIGTIAFAFSGAMLGIRKRMDLMGTIVLGVTTALGGGCIRDVILGYHPPNMFTDPSCAIQAVVSSIIIFIVCYFKTDLLSSKTLENFEKIMIYFDAIGLGAFTVTGINAALNLGYTDEKFLLIFSGMITGVGGGVIRDVFADRTPSIFREQIYASASFFGACFYLIFRKMLGIDEVMILSALIVFVIRMVAVKKDLGLPKINY
ncbi:Uncharacterized membrane protein YeiH [Peptoniphilus asaccharolyticus DSM 20463]|uniref:Uncharacterized membrane protein YeiH n=1 Tax=Peptoniphilus asaccharolyticus DSM 20463 TaxID=573058 RepID=A0A1W1VGF8_PEPAS|nr:trimeric intracellular cation channel family protein [Peptoniphilus asaccharolyticus]MBL7575840.1 trimeric intracellular cation channel family protein [Peptoniphilus asaccharolyticus]SMB92467.1 Uncharacterized membrane protein YeiH [Peptoniphilus asaccharolyticus DSM 20463]